MPSTSKTPPVDRLHPARRDALRRRLAEWYAHARRDLPWRGTRDPYAVWVSEVMLQQTTVAAVIPYWARFLERFPDLAALAAAPEEDVLEAWSGLGYYRRARNLRAAAREVVERHEGRVPESARALRALPGVGAYTAAAIASICHGEAAAVVDGNVTRVLARVELVQGNVARQPARGRIDRLARALVDPAAPGEHNQALMELGATVCTPRSPSCPSCPWSRLCRARAAGATRRVPETAPRAARVRVLDAVAVIRRRGDTVLLRRVEEGARNAGLLELPSVTLARGPHAADVPRALDESLADRLADAFALEHRLRIRARALRGRVRHGITRHAIDALVLDASCGRGPRSAEPWSWIPLHEIADRAVTGLTRKIVPLLEA